MEDFLFNKKLHLPFGSKPEGMKAEDWNLLDRHVLGCDSFDTVKEHGPQHGKKRKLLWG